MTVARRDVLSLGGGLVGSLEGLAHLLQSAVRIEQGTLQGILVGEAARLLVAEVGQLVVQVVLHAARLRQAGGLLRLALAAGKPAGHS